MRLPIRLLSLLSALCLLAFSGLGAAGPSPAEAHKVTCKKKNGAAKRKCAKQAKRHRSPTFARRDAEASARLAPRRPPRRHRARPRHPRPSRRRRLRRPPTPRRAGADHLLACARRCPDVGCRRGEARWSGSRESPRQRRRERLPAERGGARPFRIGRVDRYGRTMLDFNPLTAHVTGGFSGTTDEILQWAAHKWGIPEDVIRAAAVTESNWNMSHLGDRRAVPDPSIYPAYSRVAGTSDVYESLGICRSSGIRTPTGAPSRFAGSRPPSMPTTGAPPCATTTTAAATGADLATARDRTGPRSVTPQFH